MTDGRAKVRATTPVSGADLLGLIQTRRSIRRFEARPVPAALLWRLLTAASWAPSAHNRQPWRFAVLTSAGSQQRLARAMGARLRDDLTHDGLPEEAIRRDVERSYTRISGAPALIVLCMSLVDMDTYPDVRRAAAERVMAIQSVALAGQNLLLMAHAEGLAACWMCAPLFCPDVVKAELELPDDWEPQALLALGYPAETREKSRRRAEELAVWR